MAFMPESAIKAHGDITRIIGGLSDTERLQCVELHDRWDAYKIYSVGDVVADGNWLYRRRQPQTAPEIYPPHEALALWEAFTDEPGTHDNPIHYTIGMEIFADKFYSEDDTLYYCFRSSGAPIYNRLADLVGIYVEVSNND